MVLFESKLNCSHGGPLNESKLLSKVIYILDLP